MEQAQHNSQHERKPRRDIFPRPACILEAAQSSRSHPLALELLIFAAVFLCCAMIQGVILAIPSCMYMLRSEAFQSALALLMESGDTAAYMQAVMDVMFNLPAWLQILNLFGTLFVIAGVLLYCARIEKRSLRSMGLSAKGAAGEYLFGLLAGLALFVAAILLCLITGTLKIGGVSEDFSFLNILLFFLAYLVQGMSEEILCRGYLMISVARRQSLPVAILVSSLVFAALHLANNGLTPLAFFNLFLFGVVMAVYVVKRGNLWGAAAIHSAWNFAQGNLFGVAVSGTSPADSVFVSTLSERGAMINGGAFGLEGGLAVTLVLVAAVLLLVFKLPPKADFQRAAQ